MAGTAPALAPAAGAHPAGGPPPRDLVLVGAGHTHVQVLQGLAERPVDGVRVTLIVDRPEAVYSGMVPGFVAGDYAAPELEIDGVALARRAGAQVVLAPALRVDPRVRRIHVEGAPPLAYDLASLDLGSTVRGRDVPGVAEHALATRPIRRLVDTLEWHLARARRAAAAAARDALVVAVVGGGAAGVELAFTLEARLRRSGQRARVTVLTDEERVLPAMPDRAVRRLAGEGAPRGIALRTRARVVAVEKDAVRIEGAAPPLPVDLVVWAPGAAPPSPLAASPELPRDAAGFVRVRSTLQVEGFDDLFAAGDCASLVEHPWVPKAGVYAVRQGPLLDANLRARLAGAALRPYRPQRAFLALLNLGDRRALAVRGRFVAGGRLAWHLKDRIDRRFVARFRIPKA